MCESPTAVAIDTMERLWDLGQRDLVAGHYVSARRHLETAESIAWRRQDARSLARLYLPLLETRRQIRQNATDGLLILGIREPLKTIPHSGTVIMAGRKARRSLASAQCAARRNFSCVEALLFVTHKSETRLASIVDPTFAGGLTVRFTTAPADLIQPAAHGAVTVPLPPPGTYKPGDPLHALARESLLVAWEALALRWQARHPVKAQPWEEMAWQRVALHIDPACEPAAMRIIALAEEIQRQV